MESNTSLAIPQVLHAFNIYESGNALAGISGDVTLPDLESMTETLSGPGIAGEIEAPVLGFFSSMTVEIPFAVIYGDYFRLMKFQKNCELMLRGSIQVENKSDGSIIQVPLRVVFRGKTKTAGFGKATQGTKNENSITLELSYLKIEVDGETKFEVDKYNFKFVVDGVDLLADVRKNI